MAEYIKRDAFIAWLKRIPLKDLSDGLGLCRIIMEEDFKRAIRELPGEMIVDVAPVVHGRWVPPTGITAIIAVTARSAAEKRCTKSTGGIARVSTLPAPTAER